MCLYISLCSPVVGKESQGFQPKGLSSNPTYMNCLALDKTLEGSELIALRTKEMGKFRVLCSRGSHGCPGPHFLYKSPPTLMLFQGSMINEHSKTDPFVMGI